MKKKNALKNVAASVCDRMLNVMTERGQDFKRVAAWRTVDSQVIKVKVLVDENETLHARMATNPRSSCECPSTTEDQTKPNSSNSPLPTSFAFTQATRVNFILSANFPSQTYLREVLTRLPTLTNRQIKDVTPDAWSKARQTISHRQAA